jgi:anti-sigma factor RsiW
MNENVQTISHRTAQERILLARHGELSLPEKQQLDAHLAGCAPCRAYAAQQSDLRAALQRSNPAHNTPIPGGLPDAAKLNAHTRRVKMINQTKSSTQWVIRAGLTAAIVLLLAWVVQSRVVLRLLAGYDRQPGMPATITHINERVLPSPDFVSTAVQAPIAWTVSRGAGVKVGVIRNHGEDLMPLSLIAPDAEVVPLKADSQFLVDGKPLKDVLAEQEIRLLVLPQPRDYDTAQLMAAVKKITAGGVLVISGIDQSDASQAKNVTDLGKVGALVVSVVDGNGQIWGAADTIRAIPLFAPDLRGSRNYAPMVAAGVAALVLSAEPGLNPAEVNQRLLETADEMYMASTFNGEWQYGNVQVDSKTGDYSPHANAFHFKRVNAAKAVGAKLDTIWPVNALNAPAAWKTATGKGVIVAVLDQGFHYQNPLFEGHLVDKAAFVEGKTFESEQNFHGTAMAKIVLDVAPDASLQFLLTDERADADVQKAYVDAIDYAIAHGAKIITNSAGPWANTPEVHAAIDQAIEAGVVYVWFHYNGTNPAVIRPGYFWDSSWEVGAFDRFFDSDKPSDLEGGLSCTAPQIAGIAALILQNEPDLTPMQVKQRIIETATVLPGGFLLADAAAAVENRPSGRTLPAAGQGSMNGRMSLVYQKAGSDEKLTLEVTDQQRNHPIPILPPADVLMFEYERTAEKVIYLVQGWPENQVLYLGIAIPAASSLETGQAVIDGLTWQMDLNDYDTYYKADLTGAPQNVQVTLDGKHVRLHWESSEGIPMHRLDSAKNYQPVDEIGYRIYQLDVEGDFLPLAVVSNTKY